MLNVCIVGRVLRIIVGLTLISLSVMGSIGAWGWLGVVPLVAGIVGWCPLNKLLGMESCNINFNVSTS